MGSPQTVAGPARIEQRQCVSIGEVARVLLNSGELSNGAAWFALNSGEFSHGIRLLAADVVGNAFCNKSDTTKLTVIVIDGCFRNDYKRR